VVIDDVPAYVWNRCGERYYDAEVAKRMRALARQRSSLQKKVWFPRVRFKKTSASA